MKKRGRPETSQQPPTVRLAYYLHPQVTEVGTEPDCAAAALCDLLEVSGIVGIVDDGCVSVVVNCYELYFHGESLLNVRSERELRRKYQAGFSR